MQTLSQEDYLTRHAATLTGLSSAAVTVAA